MPSGRDPTGPAPRPRHGTRALAGEAAGACNWDCRSASRTRSRTTKIFAGSLRAIAPDAIIVVGYGRIIPQWMIDLPPLGNLNLHASLLPKYRGAAPIQWAIARGESVTGVTTMRIDAGLDTGDILLQKEIPIAPEDTAETLAPRMAAIGADLMVETLRGLQAGTVQSAAAGPRPGHAGAHSEERRWPDRFSAHGAGNPESPARLPALAGRVHHVSRQEPAPMGSAGRSSVPRLPLKSCWRAVICSWVAERDAL